MLLMPCLHPVFHTKSCCVGCRRDLLSPSAWDDVAAEFTRQACSLMGHVSGARRAQGRGLQCCVHKDEA